MLSDRGLHSLRLCVVRTKAKLRLDIVKSITQHLALRAAVRAYHESDNNGQLYDEMIELAGIDHA